MRQGKMLGTILVQLHIEKRTKFAILTQPRTPSHRPLPSGAPDLVIAQTVVYALTSPERYLSGLARCRKILLY
jgi:hypothetical protein